MSIEIGPGPVCRITIARPEQKNALDRSHLEQLAQAFVGASQAAETRVVVLTGEGGDFSSGADLAEVRDLRDEADARDYFSGVARVMRAEMTSNVPVIARVQGYCLAGAMGLVAAADLVAADEGALFGLPEVNVALFPMVVSGVLSRLVPLRLLQELALTGRRMGAEEAREAGLVTTVTSDVDATVGSWAERLQRLPPGAIREGKRALWDLAPAPADSALLGLAGRVAHLALDEEARSHIGAFFERRRGER